MSNRDKLEELVSSLKQQRDQIALKIHLGAKESQGMAGVDNEGKLRSECLKIFFDELVLHPVLTYLPRLAVCYELVRVESDIEVEIVVDHQLERFAL